jgi:hypothetical protein
MMALPLNIPEEEKSRNTSSIPAIFLLPERLNLMPYWAQFV